MAVKPLNNLQGMLFDLGGTLDGDGEHWLNRFHLLYRELLPEVSWDALKSAFSEAEAACLRDPQVATLGLAGLIEYHVRQQLAALGRSEPEKSGLLARRFLEACWAKLRRNAGVLTRLAGRFRLGVVTNSYGNASLVLAEAGMLSVLRTVVDSRVVGVRKPDPVIFSLALDSLGLPAEAAAYVGDSYGQDIRPAKRAGLTTIWLRNDAMSAPLPADFAPDLADYQIRTLPELEALVS
jgi:HAD superfamily hydrolase (TIGR01509 family)